MRRLAHADHTRVRCCCWQPACPVSEFPFSARCFPERYVFLELVHLCMSLHGAACACMCTKARSCARTGVYICALARACCVCVCARVYACECACINIEKG